MNPIVADALARMLAELPAAPSPAPGSLGYGRDLSCVTDCDDDFAEIGPDEPRIIIQSITRRLITPRGTNPDDADYGFDLHGLLHKALTPSELRQLQSQALGEVNKETRIDPSRTTLRLTHASGVVAAYLFVAPLDPRFTPFPFVLRITEAGVDIEA